MIANALHNCTLGATLLFAAGALLAVMISGLRDRQRDPVWALTLAAVVVVFLVVLCTFCSLLPGELPPR